MAIDWNGAQAWAEAYDIAAPLPGEPNRRISYGWEFYGLSQNHYERRRVAFANRNLISGANDYLVVGCGLGFMLKHLKDTYNFTRVWGIEPSTYIHSILATEMPDAEVRGRVLPLGLLDANLRESLAAAGAGRQTGPQSERGKFNGTIMTDCMLSTLADDTQVVQALNACDSLRLAGSHVFHFVMVNQPAGYLSKTLDEWVAMRPEHYWCGVNHTPRVWDANVGDYVMDVQGGA